MSDPRFAERDRKRRRRWWLRITIGVVVVALAAGLVWLVGYSTVLSVRAVEVTGIEESAEGDVREAARIPMGRPLIRVDTAGAAERIEQIDRVESVEVKRSWPRTVRIEVTERTPVGFIESGSGYGIFDGFGIEFDQVDDAPADLVRVDYSAAPEDRPEVLAEVAAVIDVVQGNGDLFDDLERIEVSGRDSIDLLLDDGTRVRWGSAENSDDKLQVFEVLRQQPASVYDVTTPHRPTTS